MITIIWITTVMKMNLYVIIHIYLVSTFDKQWSGTVASQCKSEDGFRIWKMNNATVIEVYKTICVYFDSYVS